MHPKLARLQHVLTRATRDITAEQLAFHPKGKWSAAEILEHLNLTYTGTIKNLERCLAAGQPLVTADRSKMRWQRLLITHLGFFPGGRQSPERVRPGGLWREQGSNEVIRNLVRMSDVISECQSRFALLGPIADHPLLGPLTANEWCGFHLAHGKHHARQILRLRSRSKLIQ